MTNKKTSALINSCATTFKRSGLLRLAEEPVVAPQMSLLRPVVAHPEEYGRAYPVLSESQAPISGTSTLEQDSGAFHGSAALALRETSNEEPSSSLRNHIPEPLDRVSEARPRETQEGRAIGLRAVDDFLPDGGLPTGKVTELVMSGGAAWGTRVALWACKAAQEQAVLNGTDCWCAYIDPSGSLHARGVEATGVTLSRLLVLRPSISDVERVALRLSEARVFSVIVIDLVGVPWAIRSPRSNQRTSTSWSPAGRRESKLGTTEQKRRNWPRTVRQLAMRLANTRAQVILLTEGDTEVGSNVSSQAQQGLPLPVALRVQMSSTTAGVSLKVVKEAQGRVGNHVTVPWRQWWNKSEVDESSGVQRPHRAGRAKPLDVRTERVQSLLRTVSPERQSREAGIATVASSRFARSSRASL